MQAIYTFFQRMVQLKPAVMENLESYITGEVTCIPANQIRLDSFFEKVDRPTLVIHDRDDRICPIEPIEKAAALNTKIETFITQGLGHDLESGDINSAIVNFLERENSGQ
jgi:pimeloyl-ACP methyl ester carboxylesterase